MLQLRDGEMKGLHSLARSSEAEGNADNLTLSYLLMVKNDRKECRTKYKKKKILGLGILIFFTQSSFILRKNRTLEILN